MILTERSISDLTVQLEWENIAGDDHMIVHVTDAFGTWELFPKDRQEAVEMYWHPYIYSRFIMDSRQLLEVEA